MYWIFYYVGMNTNILHRFPKIKKLQLDDGLLIRYLTIYDDNKKTY
jgi:hypothetical protein